MAKLNLPSMKKKGNGLPKAEVTPLPQIRDFTHTHTIHEITENTFASEFAESEGMGETENY